MDNAICIWCKNAKQRYGSSGCGIQCDVCGFVSDGECADYLPIDGVDAAREEVDGDLIQMANDIKWGLRKEGGSLLLLASALIDAMQSEMETDVWR